MKPSRTGGILLVLAALLVGAPAWAAEDEGAVISDILEVLKERGIVDEAEYTRLASKNAEYEKKTESFAPKLDFWGDFRFRHESFFFDSDRPDRFRIRYRFRLNAKAEVNEWADVFFRLSSGGDDPRSTNKTLGSGVDFDTDDVRLDLAYARLKAPASWIPVEGSALSMELGKVPNPFHQKVTKDLMLWDHDITLEGGQLRWKAKPWDGGNVFASGGYYIIDENSRRNDPHMWALQVGAGQEVNEDIKVGGRLSYFSFHSLDRAFILRGATGLGSNASAGGNVPDGLTGENNSGPMGVIEVAGHLEWTGHEDWPVTVFGDFAKNLDAARSGTFNADKGDTAWNVTLEVGNKKKWVALGAGWFHIEANAFPSMFVDSDVLDGRTNRQGLLVYASRTIMKNTDLSLTVFSSEEIDDGILENIGIADAKRVRVQADMKFKF